MQKIYFSDFVKTADRAGELLETLQKKYPASSFLNMFCLKNVNNQYSKRQRAKLLLSVYDKQHFLEQSLEIEPVATVRESPVFVNVEHKNETANNLNPIFVKHPQPDHHNRQVLIDELIEKFSKDAPKIIYSPETHDADADYGIESSKDDISIVSVSLADVYANQGYYERAIQMYELLKLHFPEKNSIFAARIEQLKVKMSES